MQWKSKDWRIKAVSEDESVVKSAEKKVSLQGDPKQVEHVGNI